LSAIKAEMQAVIEPFYVEKAKENEMKNEIEIVERFLDTIVEVETLVMKPPPFYLLQIPLDLSLQICLATHSDQRGRVFDSFFHPAPLIANGGNNAAFQYIGSKCTTDCQ